MKLLISALEPSSNLHLKNLLSYLDDVELLGIYDKNLTEKAPLYDISQMAIMGVSDAIKKLFWFFRVADEMVDLAKDADKILLMDSSAFNLPLAKKLKRAYPDKEIIYYILPQVWASRPKRVKQLEASCDRLLAILPFEVSYYKSHKASYVGHPLLDIIPDMKKEASSKEVIAFMPGSRKGEIEKLLPIFKEVRKRLSDKEAILIIPPSFSERKIEALYGDVSMFTLSFHTQEALHKASFAFICSGTATLEATLIGTPFILTYIAKKIDFLIGYHLLGIQEVGLANILFRKQGLPPLHTELLQEHVSVENLLYHYEKSNRTLFQEKAKEIRAYLSHGSAESVASIIQKEYRC